MHAPVHTGVRPNLSLTDLEYQWEEFLKTHPCGQFQQSTKWARVKALEGWHAHKLGLAIEPGHLWGAQILWKKTRFGRIGYVSKGPVLVEENSTLLRTAVSEICQAACGLGLRGLILQLPDKSKISSAELANRGFLPVPVPGVISATAVVDLKCGRPAIDARMNRRARQEAKQARNRGVTICFGTRADLSIFFELMLNSCRRQGVAPSPARSEVLEAVWDNFEPNVHLAFANWNGKHVAGLLMIGFGGRCTFWKKGWDQSNPSLHANCLLNVEAIYWSAEHGYRVVDFGGLDRSIAEALLAGRPLTPDQQRSRHVFNLRLGAQPQLLPQAHLYACDPVLKWVVTAWSRFTRLWSWSFNFILKNQ